MVKIRPRVLKQWRTVSPEELQKTYLSRYKTQEIKAESSWVDDLEKFKSKPYEAGEPISHEKAKFMETYGEYVDPTVIDVNTQAIEKAATKMETDISIKNVGKIRKAFKQVITNDPKAYLTKPKITKTLPKSDWAHKDPKLTKAILAIRKSSKPKTILTEAGRERDIQRVRAETTGLKIARQRAETFKTEAAKSGIPVGGIKDLEKKFLVGKSKLVKAPVASETAIAMGFPGKGTGYDPFRIGTANEMLIEFGQQAKGPSATRHPFAPWEEKKIAAWKALPVKGTFKKPHGTITITSTDPRADQIFVGQKAKRSSTGKRWTKKELTTWAAKQPKYTKPKYSKTTRILYPHISRGSKRLQRLESEVMKGLERKKGPFHWE